MTHLRIQAGSFGQLNCLGEPGQLPIDGRMAGRVGLGEV
jgi:hypothetical protein